MANAFTPPTVFAISADGSQSRISLVQRASCSKVARPVTYVQASTLNGFATICCGTASVGFAFGAAIAIGSFQGRRRARIGGGRSRSAHATVVEATRKRRRSVALHAAETQVVIGCDEDVAYRELVTWLRACGAVVSDAVAFASSDASGMRGLEASRAIASGETLIVLPLECCMVAAQGQVELLEPAAKAMERAGIEPIDAALAVAFAQERALGSKSPWWLYLRMVGDSSVTFPCFFSHDDLAELQSPPLAELMQATVEALDAVAAARGLSSEELRAAWQLVHSRRFGCDLGRFMLPGGDLANHSFTPTCMYEAPQKADQRPSWKLKALRSLSAGEPLTFTYSKDPNHLLLSNSGFVVPDNPHNRIMAKPSDLRRCIAGVLSPAFPEDFASWRIAQLEEQFADPEGDGIGQSMYLLGRNAETGKLQWNPMWLNMLGLAVTPSQNAPHWSKREGGTEAYMAALQKASWSLFDTDLEEDLSTMREGANPGNQALALEFRIGQKKLLAEGLQMFKM